MIKRDYFEKQPNEPDGPTEGSPILGIAKLQTGFHAFLPEQCLMYVGNKEVLRDDALDLAEKAEQDGIGWETVVEECVHDWFCVREVVKDKTILDRADTVFADFCYRAVIAPREGRALDQMSARRTSEGLEAVPEDNEDDDSDSDEEFHEALSTTDTELEAVVLKKLDKLEDPLPTPRNSTLTVYV